MTTSTRSVDSLISRIIAETAMTAPSTGRAALSPRVLEAIRSVPRDRFVTPADLELAWADTALSIGYGQTISQPFVVALMTDMLELEPGERVLEIGTGSGYQAAILAELGAEVYTIERIAGLAIAARARLYELGYERVHVRHGDGRLGWPEHAPYAAIVVTAATPAVPPALVDQLAVGGRLVIPLGDAWGAQRLVRIVKPERGRWREEPILGVVFVPLIAGTSGGEVQA